VKQSNEQPKKELPKRAEDCYLTEWAWLASWPDHDTATPNPAVQVGIFWTGGGDAADRAIQRVTKGPASHIGICFVLKNGAVVYYEAHWADGFAGPKAYQKLLGYQDDDPNRYLRVEWTGICDHEAEIIRQRAQALTGTLAYGKWQLVQHWFFERVQRPFGLNMRRSSGKVTCGEIAARLLFPCIDLRDEERRSFDAVNPNSALRKWLEIKQGARSTGRGAVCRCGKNNSRKGAEARKEI